MKAISGLALAGVLCMLLGGCYKATFVRHVAPAGPVRDEWKSFWVFGLVGTQEIETPRFCPAGNVRMVRTGGNFGTGLVTALTLGIWAPRKVYVQCGQGKVHGQGAASKEPVR